MHVIAGQAVVQEAEFKLPELVPHPGAVSVAVSGELQQESPVMTPMRPVKDPSLNLEPMRSRHAAKANEGPRRIEAQNRAGNRP